jgi:hypothetical protein
MPSPIPASRIQSPAIATAKATPSAGASIQRSSEVALSNTVEEVAPRCAKQDARAAAVEEPPAKRPKVKKRKKTAPKDDIDAIFGKL